MEEFDKRKKDERNKVNDARLMGNVGLAVGGALLAGGIAVHIWF
uniref:Uncharacterized protein n=1 Tax=uncultured bacterium contig00028 TaxID=1181517 RepID=A0A806K040_9BACT|nr:hypothetical protein [uncultured bacterium contig00028]